MSPRHDDGHDQPVSPPSLETGMVYLDDAFNVLRFDAWEPAKVLDAIHPVLDGARAEGRHLWDASEHYQAYAVGSWNAAARRSIGESLLAGVERDTAYDGTYPPQVVQLAQGFFLQAERWRRFTEEVSITRSFHGNPQDLIDKVNWPTPPYNHVSPLLVNGLERILGLDGADSTLLAKLYPHIEREVGGANFKPYFRTYKQAVDEELETLQVRLAHLSERWRAGLDPNREPGTAQYTEMIRCTEDCIAVGVHRLMPATFGMFTPTKGEDAPKTELRTFGVDVLGMRRAVGATSMVTFNANPLRQDEKVTAIESAVKDVPTRDRTSTLPSFSAKHHPDTTEEESAAAQPLPTFGAHRPVSPETTPATADVHPSDSSLPTFSLRANKDSVTTKTADQEDEPEKRTSDLPTFNLQRNPEK